MLTLMLALGGCQVTNYAYQPIHPEVRAVKCSNGHWGFPSVNNGHRPC